MGCWDQRITVAGWDRFCHILHPIASALLKPIILWESSWSLVLHVSSCSASIIRGLPKTFQRWGKWVCFVGDGKPHSSGSCGPAKGFPLLRRPQLAWIPVWWMMIISLVDGLDWYYSISYQGPHLWGLATSFSGSSASHESVMFSRFDRLERIQPSTPGPKSTVPRFLPSVYQCRFESRGWGRGFSRTGRPMSLLVCSWPRPVQHGPAERPFRVAGHGAQFQRLTR